MIVSNPLLIMICVMAFFLQNWQKRIGENYWQPLRNNINMSIFYNKVHCALAENWQHVTAYNTHWY